MKRPDYPRDPAQERRIPASQLREFTQQLLIKNRMFPGDAQTAALRMVESDQRGIDSHGTRALARYLPAIEACDIDPRAEIVVETETPAIAVLNGGGGLGHVASTQAMELACRKAAEVGVGAVVLRKSHHYGCCGAYALLAASKQMIGYTTTSAGLPNVIAYGSTAGGETNHGFAWAAPLPDGVPLVLDTAVGECAWGKIESLEMYGESIPEGWVLDAEGRPTTDPAEAALILPMSGPRGFGLGLISSLLTGGLAGGKWAIEKTRGPQVEGAEHFFQAIDIAAFVPLEKYNARAASAMERLRSLPPAPGFDRVRYPGEREGELALESETKGIPLHRNHVTLLEQLARAHKVEIPWE
jgi:LDH2 family malate/lactate/ureidoglycolate dehydrogenase